MPHHCRRLLLCGDFRIHGDKARPHPDFDGERLPKHPQSLMEPIELPSFDIHIHGIKELVSLIPTLPLNRLRQLLSLFLIILRPPVSAKLPADSFGGGKLRAHKAVQINIRGGKFRSPKGGRVVVHTYHNVVAPDIKAAVFKIIIFIVAGKISFDSLKKSFRPAIVVNVIAD